MKKLQIEFRVSKKFANHEYGIPTDHESFMELLSDAEEVIEKNMHWCVGGDDITFFLGDEEIGSIYMWIEEDENDKTTSR